MRYDERVTMKRVFSLIPHKASFTTNSRGIPQSLISCFLVVDGQRRVAVAHELHARNTAGQRLRVTALLGDSPIDLPGPDSSRRHDHDGGLRITRFQTVSEL